MAENTIKSQCEQKTNNLLSKHWGAPQAPMRILENDIIYLQKRRRDDVGDVFEYDGKIFRGIFHEKVKMVKEFFESGFMTELIKKRLFPSTWITDYVCEKYGLILEHERIWPVIYPQEWTFFMLKDAALMILEIAKIARKYGYNMKDCHGLNVLFSGNRPLFIDLGSFHRNHSGCLAWQPYEEFLRFYYYPLYTWKDGLEFVSKLSIFSANLIPHKNYYIYKYRLLKHFPKFLEKIIKLRFLPHKLASTSYKRLNSKLLNKNLIFQKSAVHLKKMIDKSGILESQNINRLEKKIREMERKINLKTFWGDYHDRISKKAFRFGKIVKYINMYCSDAKTAIDMGGNQGKFSLKLLKETNIKKVICQDLDEQAIDIGYQNNRGNFNISYVNYNFMAPIIKTTFPPPWKRFKSDIVIALALLHHLILGQGFALEDVLDELKKYTKKYICVEFMPKGLWTYGARVNIPDWYKVSWFKKEFLKRFDLLKEEQIAENYILFIGKLK